jgi:hypothetical protein
MHVRRAIDEQQGRAFAAACSAVWRPMPCRAGDGDDFIGKTHTAPYAAALWLAINFSYQNPAGVIPRSRSAVATALTIGGGPQDRCRHVAVIQHRVIEMVGDKAALRAVLFSSATTGSQRYPVNCW